MPHKCCCFCYRILHLRPNVVLERGRKANDHLLIRGSHADGWVEAFLLHVGERNAQINAVFCVCDGAVCTIVDDTNDVPCWWSSVDAATVFAPSTLRTSCVCGTIWRANTAA